MKATFTRPATLEDAERVAARLREEDRQEVLAAGGVDPRIVLPSYVREGREVYAAGLAEEGLAELLWGIDPIPFYDGVAVVWMLSTDRIYDYPVEFVIRTREGLDQLHERFELLTNFIDARNERHIRWLKWLGFKFLRRIEQFGAQSLPFYEFASYRQKCASLPYPPLE